MPVVRVGLWDRVQSVAYVAQARHCYIRLIELEMAQNKYILLTSVLLEQKEIVRL
jgi:hypothetical protein